MNWYSPLLFCRTAIVFFFFCSPEASGIIEVVVVVKTIESNDHLSANRRSKYLKTPMTLAASTSMAGLELSRASPARSCGLGKV